MNILKIHKFFLAFLCSIILLSCSKDVYLSGISENRYNEIKENYKKIDYSKEDILAIIGPPLIEERSENLWIYRTDKKKGIAAFKQTVYSKTLKLKFEDNVLRSVEEIGLN